MSPRFSGPQHPGAMKEYRARKRAEAQARQRKPHHAPMSVSDALDAIGAAIAAHFIALADAFVALGRELLSKPEPTQDNFALVPNGDHVFVQDLAAGGRILAGPQPGDAAAARTPFRPIGDIRPFLTIISARPIDAVDDLDITDQAAAALIVKGWTPPTNTDTHCARRPIPSTEHYFLPHTHTCLHCGTHQKETNTMTANPTTESPLTISSLQARCYQQSADKGFHDDEPTDGRPLLSLNAERIALIHSELSEALEEIRNGRYANETYYSLPDGTVSECPVHDVPSKPEGVPSEMADVVIRVLDFCGANDIDLESMIVKKLDYNASRGHKHGKKF